MAREVTFPVRSLARDVWRAFAHPRAWDDLCAKHDLRPTRVGSLGVTRKRRTP